MGIVFTCYEALTAIAFKKLLPLLNINLSVCVQTVWSD